MFYKLSEQLYKANATQNGEATGANTESTESTASDEPKNGTVYDADYKVEDDNNNQ